MNAFQLTPFLWSQPFSVWDYFGMHHNYHQLIIINNLLISERGRSSLILVVCSVLQSAECGNPENIGNIIAIFYQRRYLLFKCSSPRSIDSWNTTNMIRLLLRRLYVFSFPE